ncbi:hypothetical protein [Metabacillus sp. 84]|uniref:hypothetical protein n=1 Tax=Metabacillus sp. 84 TaxID=3404705 RepID=UPI003CF2AF61
MFKKVCPRCAKSSYSSYSGGEWICPSCSNDLTFQRVLKVSGQRKIAPVNGKYAQSESDQPVISLYA